MAHRIRAVEPNAPSTAQLSREVVIQHTIETFGDLDKAASWLSTPNAVLDNETPLRLLLSGSPQVEQVDEVLTRINYGIFS